MTQERREQIMMEKALKALQDVENKQVDTFIDLKEKVSQIVRKASKTAFKWRHLRIEYRLKDEFGMYKTHFIISDPFSGIQKKVFVKDFIGRTGAIKWQELASAIKNIL